MAQPTTPSAIASASGPALFGFCLDIFLYGILTVQVYLYYLAFPKDRRMTKIIVYSTYIIGTLQTALALHDFYTLFCTPSGSLESSTPSLELQRFGFMWFTIPLGGALVASVVQMFYAHRIYVISSSRTITGIVGMLAVVQLVTGIISAVMVFRPLRDTDVRFDAIMDPLIGGAVGAICDLLIAIYMSYYLSRQMRGAPKTTQVLVTRIVRLLLETGAITAAMAMAYAVLWFFVERGLSWFMIPGLTLGKLYANSMLVLLNNRFTILGGRNTPHPDSGITSFHRSDLIEDNARPVVSRSIAFAHSRQAETALSGGTVHTIELDSQSMSTLEELEEGGNKSLEAGRV